MKRIKILGTINEDEMEGNNIVEDKVEHDEIEDW